MYLTLPAPQVSAEATVPEVHAEYRDDQSVEARRARAKASGMCTRCFSEKTDGRLFVCSSCLKKQLDGKKKAAEEKRVFEDARRGKRLPNIIKTSHPQEASIDVKDVPHSEPVVAQSTVSRPKERMALEPALLDLPGLYIEVDKNVLLDSQYTVLYDLVIAFLKITLPGR